MDLYEFVIWESFILALALPGWYLYLRTILKAVQES